MVSSCSASGCSARHKKGNGISFHKFPKNQDLRKKWLQAIGRTKLNPSENARVCSKHFAKTDFVSHFGQRLLEPNAVPKKDQSECWWLEETPPGENFSENDTKSLENLNAEQNGMNEISESHANYVFAKTTIKNDDQSEMKCFEPANEDTPSARRRKARMYFGDFKEEDMEDPHQAKRMFSIARKIIKKQRSAIKCLRIKTDRLVKKNKLLKEIIENTENPKPKTGNCYILLQRPGEYLLTCR